MISTIDEALRTEMRPADREGWGGLGGCNKLGFNHKYQPINWRLYYQVLPIFIDDRDPGLGSVLLAGLPDCFSPGLNRSSKLIKIQQAWPDSLSNFAGKLEGTSLQTTAQSVASTKAEKPT